MKLFLVDDHGVLLAGLGAMLREDLPEAEVVGTAESGRDALEMIEDLDVDLLITDHSMPGMDGLELVRTLRPSRPELRIIVLSMHDELHLFREMSQEGVDGYVLKQASNTELTTAIRTVMAGERYVSPKLASALRDMEERRGQGSLLTRRERQILKLIIGECSNQEIAEQLFISVLTVETHRKNIFRKTGAGSLVGLVNFAHANGLVDMPR
ncbi:MAG: response regulator transcription factor [Rhodothermales bacterium]|nr:response regulator transcription factor [Rhodothermales bacterium]